MRISHYTCPSPRNAGFENRMIWTLGSWREWDDFSWDLVGLWDLIGFNGDLMVISMVI